MSYPNQNLTEHQLKHKEHFNVMCEYCDEELNNFFSVNTINVYAQGKNNLFSANHRNLMMQKYGYTQGLSVSVDELIKDL